MQVGFMMQKALGELFILKSTKPLPIIFKPATSAANIIRPAYIDCWWDWRRLKFKL